MTFNKTNAQKIEQDIITGLENSVETPLYPGDRRRIFAQAISYVVAVFWENLNEAARQRFLKYASGEVLDCIGESKRCVRIAATPAETILKFNLAAARTVDTVIAKGTRATADANVYFATKKSAVIPAGELYVTVDAEATTAGTIGNGYEIGQVNTIADQGDVPFISSVINTTLTAGGDPGEPYPYDEETHPDGDNGEGDERFRQRIYLAGNAYSTAGAIEAYKYHTLSANAGIDDVEVLSLAPGHVDVFITGKNGTDATQAMISDVLEKLNEKTIRPLGDLVSCQSPEAVTYDINIKYYTTAEDEAAAVAGIENEKTGAITQFIAWQDVKIGRDITPDRLRAFCLEHCLRLDVIEPQQTKLNLSQKARHSGKITVTHAIIEE